MCDTTSHPFVKAYGQTSLDRYVHVGHVACRFAEQNHCIELWDWSWPASLALSEQWMAKCVDPGTVQSLSRLSSHRGSTSQSPRTLSKIAGLVISFIIGEGTQLKQGKNKFMISKMFPRALDISISYDKSASSKASVSDFDLGRGCTQPLCLHFIPRFDASGRLMPAEYSKTCRRLCTRNLKPK